MGMRSEVKMIEVFELVRLRLIDSRTGAIVMMKAPTMTDSFIETVLALLTVVATFSARGVEIGLFAMLCLLTAHRVGSAVWSWRDYVLERTEHERAMRDLAQARRLFAMTRAESSTSESGAS
jgi:predicted exporter